METDEKESRILSLNNIKPPVVGRCGFFVKRKQRYCKMLPAKGNQFCAEHLSQEADCENKRKRIICPLDNKHTVFEDKLEKHMKKCNATRKTQLPYYTENINLGLKDFQEEEVIPLYATPIEELKALISKVKVFYDAIKEKIAVKEKIGRHSVVEDELKIPEYGQNVKKHLLQQGSLLEILESQKVMEDNMIILEFGAGRGALSHWIQKAMKGTLNKFLLIDRQHNRNKEKGTSQDVDVENQLDCYHKGDDQGPNFERLNIDIQNLNLGCVSSILDNDMKLTGVGKHLCGGATDLSLRCLLESQHQHESNLNNDATNESLSKKQKFESIQDRLHCVLFALCCYHRCTWNTYVGTDVLLESGFTPNEFHRITKMAGWATCGFQRRNTENKKKQDMTNDDVMHNHDDVVSETDVKRHEELNLTSLEQEEIGRMCKKIIDFGRLEYLRRHGYNAELFVYIDSDVTPENIALFVSRKPST